MCAYVGRDRVAARGVAAVDIKRRIGSRPNRDRRGKPFQILPADVNLIGAKSSLIVRCDLNPAISGGLWPMKQAPRFVGWKKTPAVCACPRRRRSADESIGIKSGGL